MGMWPRFDPQGLIIKPLHERKHDLNHDTLLPLDAPVAVSSDAVSLARV